MAAPKVFVIGITGYIGGTAFATLAERHPDWTITASVRTEEQAKKVQQALPKVKTVIGDLDNDEVLSSESAKADIVINCAHADHEGAVKSIIKGLNQRQADTPGYYIHNSGTGILIDLKTTNWGDDKEEKLLSDVDDIKEILALPESNLHVKIDNLVRNSHTDKVRTAVVCPPVIYDQGTGPDRVRSVQAPDLVKYTIKRGKAFAVGKGNAMWNNVNVKDLAEAYVLLAENAANGGGAVNWGPEAFFFVEAGEHRWADLSREVGRVGVEKGYLKTPDIENFTKEELEKQMPENPYGPLLWGSNSRGKADRLRKLGWTPKHDSLFDSLPSLYDREAKALGV